MKSNQYEFLSIVGLAPSSKYPFTVEIVSLTSSPRFSAGLVTSLLAHAIWLPLVLRNAGVDAPILKVRTMQASAQGRLHLLDDIRSNWRPEDIGERVGGLSGRTLSRNDADCGSAGHFCLLVSM